MLAIFCARIRLMSVSLLRFASASSILRNCLSHSKNAQSAVIQRTLEAQRTINFFVALPKDRCILLDLFDGLLRQLFVNTLKVISTQKCNQYWKQRKKAAILPAILFATSNEALVVFLVPSVKALRRELLSLGLLFFSQRHS